MYLVDANIFLELELAHSKGKACRDLLEKFHKGGLTGLITDFHVDTIVIVMENHKLGWEEIRIFLSSLMKYRGLTMESLTLGDKLEATSHMKEYKLDYDDALAYQCMRKNKIKKIISYDKDFDSIPEIERLEPGAFSE